MSERCSYKTSAPSPLPNPRLSSLGSLGATLGMESFFYAASVPGWLPVLTVAASKATMAGAIVPVGPMQGSRKACNPRVYGTPRPFGFEASSKALEPFIFMRGKGSFGTTRPSVLTEAGSNGESGEGKGIR